MIPGLQSAQLLADPKVIVVVVVDKNNLRNAVVFDFKAGELHKIFDQDGGLG